MEDYFGGARDMEALNSLLNGEEERKKVRTCGGGWQQSTVRFLFVRD